MHLRNEYSDLIAYRLNGIEGQDGRYYILKNRGGRSKLIVSDVRFKEILTQSRIPKVYAFVELNPSEREVLHKLIWAASLADYNFRAYNKDGELMQSFIRKDITENEVGIIMRATYVTTFGEINYDLENQKVTAERIVKREEY
jgi:hypothetical protein